MHSMQQCPKVPKPLQVCKEQAWEGKECVILLCYNIKYTSYLFPTCSTREQKPIHYRAARLLTTSSLMLLN